MGKQGKSGSVPGRQIGERMRGISDSHTRGILEGAAHQVTGINAPLSPKESRQALIAARRLQPGSLVYLGTNPTPRRIANIRADGALVLEGLEYVALPEHTTDHPPPRRTPR